MKARYKFIQGRRSTRPEQIELEVYVSAKCRVYIATGYDIPVKYWDAARQRVSPKMANAIAIDDYMTSLKNRIEAKELDCIKNERPFGREEIKRAANGGMAASSDMMVDLFRKYNDDQFNRNEIKIKTWQKHTTEINKLSAFLSIEKGRSDVPISTFDGSMVTLFDAYLQQAYQVATIGKLHFTMKMYIQRALEEGKINNDPYRNFKVKKGHTKKREALTEREVEQLEQLDRVELSKIDERLPLVLDKLLLSVYCGLRIGDNASLLKTEIRDESEGLVIDKVTEKMDGTRVLLPLRVLFGGKGEAIVRRYMQQYPDLDTVFPAIPDQKVNERLKTLAMMAHISMNLTFHIARHTCATLLAEKTGNPFVVMKILGHKDIKTSMIYIHNSYTATIRSLENAKW